ncbi:unnamed protein product [Sphenostylis stenocarpa]|uniref:Uncharacterized protein n=1 Tax=Sphenostylis stenocarpa TaxID=92480 RepID=A0AA86RVL6_9FABA|nr:unnamed protein product [Sphenostylis stenocarpa]
MFVFLFWVLKASVTVLKMLCKGVVNPYLAVHSIMMVPYLLMRFVMIGARVQKITIQLLRRTTFICTCHRNLRLKASHELELRVESEISC